MRKMNENCYSCREFRADEVLKGMDVKPCPYYPDNLPTTKDIVEVYCCEHYDPITITTTVIHPDKKELKQMRRQPISPLDPSSIPFIIAKFAGGEADIFKRATKYEDILRKAERRAFIIGIIIGGTITLTLLLILSIIMGGF